MIIMNDKCLQVKKIKSTFIEEIVAILLIKRHKNVNISNLVAPLQSTMSMVIYPLITSYLYARNAMMANKLNENKENSKKSYN